MSIFPLPVYEADADPHNRDAMSDAEILERLESPKSIVVRFGAMRLVGEYPYNGDAKPGCGSKLVVRTHRGTEIGEMLTTTCENAGCGKSVTRQEMRDYISASGGKDFPFYSNGRILRVATIEDLNEQGRRDAEKPHLIKVAKQEIAESGLEMRLVDVEPIFGGELLTFYYTSENRVDFRDLVKRLATHFPGRIEMRQVGARDEARLVADYERCGQYCCCKSFLKVLKPVSMGAAKMQKATLDPLKISGRCGRLMCCLRYEDQTYRELKANLPHRKTRVGTVEGAGIVMETKTLVQLVLVRLEEDGRQIAVPVEELCDPDNIPPRVVEDPLRGLDESTARRKQGRDDTPPERRKKRRRRGRRGRGEDSGETEAKAAPRKGEDRDAAPPETGDKPKRKRRRRRKPRGGGDAAKPQGDAPASGSGSAAPDGGASKPKKKRRRRRRRGGGSGGGGASGGGDESS